MIKIEIPKNSRMAIARKNGKRSRLFLPALLARERLRASECKQLLSYNNPFQTAPERL